MSLPPEQNPGLEGQSGDTGGENQTSTPETSNRPGGFLGFFRREASLRSPVVVAGGEDAAPNQDAPIEAPVAPNSEPTDTTVATLGGGGDRPPGNGNPTELENEPNPEDNKIPSWWPEALGKERWDRLEGSPGDRTVTALQYYNELPFEERAKPENIKGFLDAKEAMKIYAGEAKLYDLDERKIEQNKRLRDFDTAELERVKAGNVELAEVLQNLIDDLDRADYNLKELTSIIEKNGQPIARPLYYPQKEWEELQRERERFTRQRGEIEVEIGNRARTRFLQDRENLQNKINAQIGSIEKRQQEEKEEKAHERNIDWILELERKLLEDSPPEKPNDEANYTVENTLRTIEQEEDKPEDQRQKEVLEKARARLEWYLYNAAQNGVFADLAGGLDREYLGYAQEVFGAKVIPLEIVEKIERSAQTYAAAVEGRKSWAMVVEKLPPNSGIDIRKYRGIRAVFIDRAYEQMFRLLSNNLLGREIYTPLKLYGGWNHREIQGRDAVTLNKREQTDISELFYREDEFRVELTGKDRKELESGVENFVSNLLRGANYDIQKILNRMGLLSAGIERAGIVLRAAEGLSSDEATKVTNLLRRSTENRVYFFLAQHFANIIQTEKYAQVLETWADSDGLERFRTLVGQTDGLVGLTFYLLKDPKYQMYFRSEGFRGQLLTDQVTQRYLRKKLKEQLEDEVAKYELDLENPEDSGKKEEIIGKIAKASSEREFLSYFRERKENYQGNIKGKKKAFKELKEGIGYPEFTERFQSLTRQGQRELIQDLKQARRELFKAEKEFNMIKNRAKLAVELALQAFDALGESGKLGAPSIIMDNDDHIRVDDVLYFAKYAVHDHIRRNRSLYEEHYTRMGLRYGVDLEEGHALIRWRGKEWLKKQEHDQQGNPIVKAKFTGANGAKVEVTYKLKKGFEDTGLTLEEWEDVQKAFKNLRREGFLAKIGDKKFEEIIKLNEVRPVLNSFLGADFHSNDLVNSDFVVAEVAKGRQPWLAGIRERLKMSGRVNFGGRKRIAGETPQSQSDIYTDLIEDSRSFDSTMWKLVYYEGTRAPKLNAQGQKEKNREGDVIYTEEFTPDRLMMGYPALPLAVKRMEYLIPYWVTNLRSKVGRAEELLPFLPIRWSGISEEFSANSLLETIWIMDKEAFDIFYMMQLSHRVKDIQAWRSFTETSISDKFEDDWKFWDKPTSDAVGNMRKVFAKHEDEGVEKLIEKAKKDSFVLHDSEKDEILAAIRSVISRFIPLAAIIEKQFSYDRSVPGSGAGIEEADKLALRYIRWVFSETGSRDRRLQGGVDVNKQAKQILRFVAIPGTFEPGVSLWQEAWRKWRPNRDPGLSQYPPQPVML